MLFLWDKTFSGTPQCVAGLLEYFLYQQLVYEESAFLFYLTINNSDLYNKEASDTEGKPIGLIKFNCKEMFSTYQLFISIKQVVHKYQVIINV
jgi:hypothetical protein